MFKQNQFYSVTLLYHIFTSSKMCVPKSSVQHTDTTLYPGGLSRLSCSCLEDKGWKLLNPPSFSWVFLSLEALINIGLACLYLLEVDSHCDFSSLSCPASVNHQDLYTAFCLLIWVSYDSYSVHCLPTMISKCTESLL